MTRKTSAPSAVAPWLSLVIVAFAALGGCSDAAPPATTPGDTSGLTYYGDTKAIVDARCATCHRAGDIGPFPLTTYEEVQAFAGPVRASVLSGSMPPWQPSADCNSYLHNIDLRDDERETLLAWLDAGTPEGDPADAPETTEPDLPGFEADLSLQLPEPYTPVREPDDYRCQLIEWPAETTQYVTGLRVTPDQRAIVHHVIMFVASPEQAEQYRAYDAGEEGPGYTCYGGPTADGEGTDLSDLDPAELLAVLERLGISVADVRSGNLTPEQQAALFQEIGGGMGGAFRTIGSWVPGTPAAPFPAGTGIRVEPGSLLVAQFHYNTLSAAPVADQSTIEIAVADSVEREATTLPVLDVAWVSNGLIGGDAMTIPAGEANVEHSTTVAFDALFAGVARDRLGLAPDAPLVIHSANHHMHELGRTQRAEIRHADGSTSCLLDIPDWDFQWQGAYTLENPVTFRPSDTLWMGCSWDNSAANQPIIDGVAREPMDVSWGEGTTDEMCLGSYYVTRE